MPRRRPHDPSVASLAARAQEGVDALVDDIVTRISEQIDVYRSPLIDRAELRRSVSMNVQYLLGQLSDPGTPDLDAPTEIGRVRAEQDVPLPEVLRAYRIGFAMIWRRLAAEARRSGARSTDALLDTATKVWELADEYSLALTESYRAAVSERLVAADRRRSGVVAALLAGHPDGRHSPWELAKLLDMPFEGTFLVVVAATIADGGTALPHLDDRLRSMDVVTAWRAQTDHEVGVLAVGRRRRTSEVVAVIQECAVGRVGVSPEYRTIDQTPRAFRFAQVALEALPVGANAVRQLPNTAIGELLVRDRDATSRYVRRVLHNVLALPDDDRSTLLATAEAWLTARGSAAQAGRVLYCHENTVRHRIRRLEEHLGMQLDDPRNLADLSTALEAIRAFPELGTRLVDPSPDA